MGSSALDVFIAVTAAASLTDASAGGPSAGLDPAPDLKADNFAELLDPASRSYMMVRDIDFDDAGNIYVTGGAFSSKFPATAGAYDRKFSSGGSSAGSIGPSDAFVMKFGRTGELIWSTLIGGPNYDRAYGLEIAPDGGVVIAGRAGEGFPTTRGVVQPEFAGDSWGRGAYGRQDGFIAKLSADGSTLLWSTYFGDTRGGALRDVAVDSDNRIYVAGTFFGGLAHVTANALQSSPNGSHDLVYARLSSDAAAVEYATYIGGQEDEGSKLGTPALAVTPDRNVYLVHKEGGIGAPTTQGAYQRESAGGDDLLIARFSPADHLQFATYLGGSGNEELETHNIAVDASGQVAVALVTNSKNYPVTPGAYQTKFGGGRNDGAVSILSADGSSLVASTYFGGHGLEDIQGVEFAPDGRLYFSGGTRSSDIKTTSDAFQANFSGVMDAFLAAMTPDFKSADYFTYLGGAGGDIARAMSVSSDGAVALGGHLSSPDFPAAAGGSTEPTGEYTGWWALLAD